MTWERNSYRNDRETLQTIMTDRIPSQEECYDLMAAHAMLSNIVDHSRQVMRVSLAIVDHLTSEAAVNRDRVIAGALLHDIAKTKSLTTKEHHDASGAEILRALGFNSIAEIVEQHVFLHHVDLHGRLEEREIVYYADKRVMHDRIVTVDERIHDLIQRYGATETVRNKIHQNKETILAIESKIADFMDIDIHHAIRDITTAETDDHSSA